MSDDILFSWKKITRGLPEERRYADDGALSIEEIRKITEYPDRRIKGSRIYCGFFRGSYRSMGFSSNGDTSQPIEREG